MFSISTGRKSARRWAAIGLAGMSALSIMGSGSWGPDAASAASPDPAQPNATCPAGGQCFADVPASNAFYAFINTIYQQDLITGYACGGPGEPCDAYNRPYYHPNSNVTRQQMAKFIDNARHLPQIDIQVAAGSPPIRARNDTGTALTASSTSGQAFTAQSSTGVAIYAQTGEAAAVSGYSTGSGSNSFGLYGSGNTGVEGHGGMTGVKGTGGTGVWGAGGTNGTGVYGNSTNGYGLHGLSSSSDGVYGESTTGVAIYGYGYPNAWAGWFVGNVRITGTCCSMASGTTQIDDPTDPAGKYLNQSLVQSPDMTTVVNGNAMLDDKGQVTVSLPAWFEASNHDCRYSLTAVGAPGPNLYIAQELSGNQFMIAGGEPGSKVSWQVTGIRQDPYAIQHPVVVEQAKPAGEQGMYLYPELYNQPESKKISGKTETKP